MGDAAPTRKMTYAEYLAMEDSSSKRHEFVNGELWAMAGGRRDHALVQTGFLVALARALGGSPCRPATSDARVYIPAYEQALYPDLHVVCGRAERDPVDPEAVVNPSLVVEVLSPTTEAWDRGGKFDRYASLDSVQEYALVSVDEERVEVFRRNEDGSWTRRLYRTGAVELASVGTSIAVDDIYGLVRAERAAGGG